VSYLTIRLPDDQIKRLKQLAAQRHVSMSMLFEQISAQVLSELPDDQATANVVTKAVGGATGTVKALPLRQR